MLFGLRVPLVQTSRRAAPEAAVPENPVTEETDPLLATQLGPSLPTPLATDVPPAAQPNEPRPPAAEKTNRPPVLLAPIEPADPPAPADPSEL